MNTIRLLARRVEHRGTVHAGLSLVEARLCDDGLWHIAVTPFERETASTPYHSGTVTVADPADHSLPYSPSAEPPALICR